MEAKLKFRWLSLLIVIPLMLAACGGGESQPGVTPTYDDAAMATQISQLLTAMPTTSPEPVQLQVDATPVEVASPTVTPTFTNTVLIVNTPAGTATLLPTAEATETIEGMQPSETLEVTNTATSTLTPTATITSPVSDPRASLGEPDWLDPLDDGQNWPLGEDDYASLQVEDGHLVFTGLTLQGGWRMATTPKLKDFYAEMTASPVNCVEGDYYGFFFRVPEIHLPDQGYLFGVSCGGGYSLRLWDGEVEPDGKTTTLVHWTPGDSIQSGPGQSNRIGVMAVGSRITMYVNGVLLKEHYDDTFPEGYLGIFINAEQTENFTIHVDDVSYWRNP
jgi:hypothetical protein